MGACLPVYACVHACVRTLLWPEKIAKAVLCDTNLKLNLSFFVEHDCIFLPQMETCPFVGKYIIHSLKRSFYGVGIWQNPMCIVFFYFSARKRRCEADDPPRAEDAEDAQTGQHSGVEGSVSTEGQTLPRLRICRTGKFVK